MKYYSIRTKVSILFFVVFVLVCILFFISINLEAENKFKNQFLQQENTMLTLINEYEKEENKSNFLDYLIGNHFHIIKNNDTLRNLRQNGDEIFKLSTAFGNLSLVFYQDKLYLALKNENYDLYLQGEQESNTFDFIIFGFFTSLCLSLALYFSIINSLIPLKRMHEQLSSTLEGKAFSADVYKDDEVGKIATQFEKILSKNRQLIESRQLFLRTIMHELKTPIGKGRLVAEMIKEEKQKERLIEIFKRLDNLINESARIESLYSRNYEICIEEVKFEVILKQVKDLLMLDNFNEKVRLIIKEEASFKVDVEMFSVMLKNLIDNALKYSPNHHCELEVSRNLIIISNEGVKLRAGIKEYMKAFWRDKNTQVSGMGLGLYIVERICLMHHFNLDYSYENKRHIFKIYQAKDEREI